MLVRFWRSQGENRVMGWEIRACIWNSS